MAKNKLRTIGHRVILNRTAGGDTIIFVMLGILGVLMFLPMYMVIINAFKPLNELFLFPPRFYVISPTWDNFSDLFTLIGNSVVPFSRYIFNTVFISVTGTFGNLVLSSLAAYALSKIEFPGRNFFFQMIVKSLMFTATVGGIVQFIIISKLGLMDSQWAVILIAWCTTLGLYLMKQFMESNITDAILESARLDGASELRVFWSIAMPMVKPAWLTLIIYSFQGLWKMGESLYIQSEQLKTLTCAVNQILSAGVVRAGASAASTLILMLVPIAVFVISQSKIIETMGSSGMKD
ncbi:MAG: carbohydrate ABC transporter permease [Clostridia bacterium]|nr:carbohydrate ABC transporter permease [Clostridia bacterium]